ncbi:site-specific integrase [Aeromonas caviae]|uniref:site-specific integrase n=1 Tax=Aeromonas caviae TaxID=648 RepID=UPI003EC6002E
MATKTTQQLNNGEILSSEQRSFLERLHIPSLVTIMTDSKFDSVTAETSSDIWRFTIGGEKNIFNFTVISNVLMRKFAKFCCVSFINSGSPLRGSRWNQMKHAFDFQDFSYNGFKAELSSKDILESPEKYTSIKALLRLLCQINFPGFAMENLEDFILIPVPNTINPFLKYQDLENAFPSPLKGLISRSIISASKRVDTLSDDEIINFTLFGLSYYTGMRPIQFSKITVEDFKIDTKSESSGLYRYSLNMPYGKQTKITNDKVKIALPAEIGVLVQEYVKRNNLNQGDRFVLIDEYIVQYLNDILQKMLFSIQPLAVQEQVVNGSVILPRLTTYDFRHNVGHSLALAGASADEIAYMLGHSSLIAATYYISATPELAMLKSKALGDNPVWQNMINLLLTGYAVEEKTWLKRTVSGSLGGKLHIKIGGCERPDEDCTLAKVRSCYGCFYFRPFTDLVKHNAILDCINKELIDTLEVSEKSGNIHNPALEIIANFKGEVQMVINRIKGGLK